MELNEFQPDRRKDDIYLTAEQQKIDEDEPANLGSDNMQSADKVNYVPAPIITIKEGTIPMTSMRSFYMKEGGKLKVNSSTSVASKGQNRTQSNISKPSTVEISPGIPMNKQGSIQRGKKNRTQAPNVEDLAPGSIKDHL